MGDPRRLSTGFDYRAQLCGVGELKDFEYTYVLQPEVSLAATCLDGCPIVSTASSVCLYDSSHEYEILSIPCYDSYVAKGYYNHYCLPASPEQRSAVKSLFESRSFELTHLLGDASRGWDLLAAGVLVAISTSAVVVTALQISCLRTVLSYSAFSGSLALVSAVSYFVFEESARADEHYCDDFGPVLMRDCKSPERYRPVAYTSVGVLCIFALCLLYQVPKIARGRRALRLSVLPQSDVHRLSLLPVAGALLSFGLVALTLSAVLYLASCADVVDREDHVLPVERRKDLVFGEWQRLSCIFLVLVALWWVSLMAFWVEFVAASVSQSWYFAKDRKYVHGAYRKALRHALLHTGSLAYAAVMLPLLLLPRNFLSATKALAKRMDCTRSRCYLKSCYCCLAFYESSLKYKVEQMVANQALGGESLESASRKSFFLVRRSESQPQQLLAACHFVIWTSEICILLAAPAFVYYSVLHRSATLLDSPTKFITSGLWLSLLTGSFSWALAAVIRGYIRGCAHGVILAYLCEQEMFPGLQRSENIEITQVIEDFAPPSVAEVVAEESLKPSFAAQTTQKRREKSRVDVLREMQITNNSKTLDSEIDELGQTGIDFSEGETAQPRPWTPELKFKQKQPKPRPAEESLPIDDSRPFSGGGGDEPDFRPYRFVDLIKAPPAKAVKTQSLRVQPETSITKQETFPVPQPKKPVRRLRVL